MLAAERYKSVWNMFLQALNHDPTACLRAFQCEQHVNKRSMARWMRNASIKDLGKKWFGFSKMEILTLDELVERINRG